MADAKRTLPKILGPIHLAWSSKIGLIVGGWGHQLFLDKPQAYTSRTYFSTICYAPNITKLSFFIIAGQYNTGYYGTFIDVI